MRLERYLNEETSEEIVQLIKKNCKKFLKESKGNYVYRAVDVPDDFLLNNVRLARMPKGTSLAVFDGLNDELKKHKHTRRDKSVYFCSGNKESLQMWDKLLHYVFPIGNYSYSWCPSYDFNENNFSKGWDSGKLMNAIYYKDTKKNLSTGDVIDYDIKTYRIYNEKEAEDTISWHMKSIVTNKKLDHALKNGYEIWFKGKQYYTLAIDYVEKNPQILKQLGEN